jgi:hypothetical protein
MVVARAMKDNAIKIAELRTTISKMQEILQNQIGGTQSWSKKDLPHSD